MKLIRKHIFIFLLISVFLYTNTACIATPPIQPPVATPTVAPTATPTATPTVAPTATPTVAPTPTVALTATPTVTPTATPTLAPSATPTVAPTATPTVAPTATPTVAPTATPTVAPTATPTVAPTATPTVAPTATPTVAPTATPTVAPTATPTPTVPPTTGSRFPNIVNSENIIMQGTTLHSSEEDANRFFFEMVLKGYYNFGILAKDLSMLHTADEYMEIYSELSLVEIGGVTKYNNGYYLHIWDAEAAAFPDVALRYAVRTGDTSFLSADEKKCYDLLYRIADSLRLTELTPIDAVVAVHDYLVLNAAYDMQAYLSGENTPSHTATGTLLNGNAVCSGYASAFLLFMQIAGIPCEYAHNDTHAWNLVQLDNEWYHIDVTWDDPTPDRPGMVSYSFFMMTDAEIESYDDHHAWECECPEHIPCTDTKYRLYPYRDSMCTNTQEALNLIISQLDQGEISLVYPIDSELNQDVLLQLAMSYSNGKLSYYPPAKLGDSHYLLTIVLYK